MELIAATLDTCKNNIRTATKLNSGLIGIPNGEITYINFLILKYAWNFPKVHAEMLMWK